jgi:hypothetical protein
VVKDVDLEMMLGPASWQAPIRLACHPNLGRHILVFSRSISRNTTEPSKDWTRIKGWKKTKSSTANSNVGASSPVFEISPEVARALRDNAPIVALETTIYTHGFPYPDNIALALDLEKIVRANGAIPATIGVVGGVARVGLTKEEIITLASSAGKPETMKVSRRDLPYILGMVCQTIFTLQLMYLSPCSKQRLSSRPRESLGVSSMAERQSPEPCFLLPKLASKFSGQVDWEVSIVEAKRPWTSQPTSLNLVALMWR